MREYLGITEYLFIAFLFTVQCILSFKTIREIRKHLAQIKKLKSEINSKEKMLTDIEKLINNDNDLHHCPFCKKVINRMEAGGYYCNNCGHEWQVYHMFPVNDIAEHRDSYDCPCFPKVQHEKGNVAVIHNSFDGKEGAKYIFTPYF